jgi:crossover junction endodeoxyribonuclease RusA
MTPPTTRARICSVTLPWPSTALSPNTPGHWSALARAKKAYRADCAWHAKAQGMTRIEADRLHVHLTFHKPTRRAMDLDNLLARMKSGLDGLADVLGVDDSRWTLSLEVAPTVGGMVVVEVSR